MICPNCGRNWSEPVPETCPECGASLTVTKQVDEPARDKQIKWPSRKK